jgi:hypothetical protein
VVAQLAQLAQLEQLEQLAQLGQLVQSMICGHRLSSEPLPSASFLRSYHGDCGYISSVSLPSELV